MIFWHDLALALGVPVGELRLRITSAEFMDWVAYSEITGPLGYRRRYDQPAALVAWASQAAAGGKAKYADFLPAMNLPDEPEDGFNDVDRQLLKALNQPGQNRFS